MATIETDEDFRRAISYLVAQGQLLVTVARFVDAASRKVYDETSPITDITPDTATLESALDNANAAITQAATIETAQSGLLDKVLIAEQYASDIRTIYNLVLTFTENQVTQPTRFNDLLTAFTASATAFRNRFITDCEQELGFNPTGTLSAAQQRQATLYARVWITPLVLLLMARKLFAG